QPARRPRRALAVDPHAHVEPLPTRAPPRSATGVSGFLRANFFGSPGNTAATILFGGVLAWALPPAFNWLAGNAVWHADYAARRSNLPLLRSMATLYIELVRGVPLITVLFTASFVFPLLLPQGIRLDVLTRVALGIVLFQAAYMAEVVRGGLQALPKGQYEAA